MPAAPVYEKRFRTSRPAAYLAIAERRDFWSRKKPRPTPGSPVSLALVEEEAGLLAADDVRGEVHAVFLERDRFRSFAEERARRVAERLFLADREIAPLDDDGRRERLAQRGHDLRPAGVHARGRDLEHQYVLITVDDKARQAVGLAEDGAIAVGRFAGAVAVEAAPVIGFLELRGEPGLVDDDLFVAELEQPDRDGRFAGVRAGADDLAGDVLDADDLAVPDVVGTFGEGSRKDPGMPEGGVDLFAFLQRDGRIRHKRAIKKFV